MKKQLYALYGIIILLVVFYLFAVEGVADGTFLLHQGGRDYQFTFFDITLFLVLALSVILTVISSVAYSRRQKDAKGVIRPVNRLFFVSFAFFLFSVKSALKIIDNFLIGGYSYIGISIQTLEFLILLSLFYALFRK
ncbi:MAG: hypothetical protein HY515_03445 [Candidatus Aenigmarchaeota archaeon]|nr:hypothetical protein [Candidatus Aenigmarchaeota archaeon]